VRQLVRLSRIPSRGTLAAVVLVLALAGCQAGSGSPSGAGAATPSPDALKVVNSDEISFEMLAPNRPGLLKGGPNFTYVIMPVNLQ